MLAERIYIYYNETLILSLVPAPPHHTHHGGEPKMIAAQQSHLIGKNSNVHLLLRVLLEYVPNHAEITEAIVAVLYYHDPTPERLVEVMLECPHTSQLVLRHMPAVFEITTQGISEHISALALLVPHIAGLEGHVMSTNPQEAATLLATEHGGIDTKHTQHLLLKLAPLANHAVPVAEACSSIRDSVSRISGQHADIVPLSVLGCRILATNAYDYGLLLTAMSPWLTQE